jgi:hypothetical protein
MKWTLPLSRWVSWDCGPDQSRAPTTQDLSFIDPNLRRRLSPLARISLKVAHECASEAGQLRLVYVSRHGDLNRSTSLLNDLAVGQPLSPTAFSTSVLNASAGMYSILRKDTRPSTAVSAGLESFGYGLLEASLQWASDPSEPVLLVYADEPALPEYGDIEGDVNTAHAIGLLIGGEETTAITCQVTAATNDGAPCEPTSLCQSKAFLDFLEQDFSASSWLGAGRRWSWKREEA